MTHTVSLPTPFPNQSLGPNWSLGASLPKESTEQINGKTRQKGIANLSHC